MLVTFHKTGEVFSHLLGTNGFHAKAKNERFTAAGTRWRQNKFKSCSGSLAGEFASVAQNLTSPRFVCSILKWHYCCCCCFRVHRAQCYCLSRHVIDLFSLYGLFPISDHVMLLQGIVSFNSQMSSYARANVRLTHKRAVP